MALVLNNRVRELTSTTGTGAVTLGGAVGGFQTFAAGIGNSNTTYYAISINSENEWEVGLGTLNGDSSTLTRTTVLESSNSDSAVDFSAGSKEVFCTLPSEKAVYLDASDDQVGGFSSLAADTSPQLGGDLDVNGQDIVSTSNADIDIIPNGSGDVNLGTDTVQVGDNNVNATITTQGTGDLTLNTNNGTNAGNIILEDGANGDITLTPNGTGEVVIDGLIHPQADGNTGEFLKTDGAGNLDFAAIQGGNITTEGEAFSNYNQITDDRTTTTSATSNMFLAGLITVADTKTWTVAGAGTLTII